MLSTSTLNSKTIQDTTHTYVRSLVYITFHFPGISFPWEKWAVRINKNPEQYSWETLLNTVSLHCCCSSLALFSGDRNRKQERIMALVLCFSQKTWMNLKHELRRVPCAVLCALQKTTQYPRANLRYMVEDLKQNPHNKTKQLQCVTSWEQ